MTIQGAKGEVESKIKRFIMLVEIYRTDFALSAVWKIVFSWTVISQQIAKCC